jgi:hypothetical protein
MSDGKLRALMLAGALACAGMTWACDSKGNGNLEKAGEKLDNATDDLTRDSRDLKDGAAENLGEKIDKAGGNTAAPDKH